MVIIPDFCMMLDLFGKLTLLIGVSFLSFSFIACEKEGTPPDPNESPVCKMSDTLAGTYQTQYVRIDAFTGVSENPKDSLINFEKIAGCGLKALQQPLKLVRTIETTTPSGTITKHQYVDAGGGNPNYSTDAYFFVTPNDSIQLLIFENLGNGKAYYHDFKGKRF